jgi:hypothetical protein
MIDFHGFGSVKENAKRSQNPTMQQARAGITQISFHFKISIKWRITSTKSSNAFFIGFTEGANSASLVIAPPLAYLKIRKDYSSRQAKS